MGDLRVVKTKAAIREALFGLMSEKELAKITISEICARAKINRKTFYAHYRAPSDVIEELENEVLEEFSAILRSGGDSLLNVSAAIRDISATIEQRREFFKQFMFRNPDLFNKGKIKAMLCRVITVSLKNAGAPHNEETLKAAAEFSISGVLALYSAWFDGDCRDDLDFITSTAINMVTRGLSAYVPEDKLSKVVTGEGRKG
ncbi:MAG: TetR/AcrR family transcriptional regulator [Oscillospiraceae bacterium]|nr:TetR/AcrR family transcriptional regulator [Oscillospiraceae bacterium]